ncbi:hypothetical protein AVEN_254783-1 [Araneus ventricosus]|uniref:Uncharacterized protein n=1 Tax=Araneus ventricosus TaxID=182803 RepID=A0A4Y2QGT9_ARAVE|nr:hypothetical protein AVEN_254783-1 [Araneus ventricosus]
MEHQSSSHRCYAPPDGTSKCEPPNRLMEHQSASHRCYTPPDGSSSASRCIPLDETSKCKIPVLRMYLMERMEQEHRSLQAADGTYQSDHRVRTRQVRNRQVRGHNRLMVTIKFETPVFTPPDGCGQPPCAWLPPECISAATSVAGRPVNMKIGHRIVRRSVDGTQ